MKNKKLNKVGRAIEGFRKRNIIESEVMKFVKKARTIMGDRQVLYAILSTGNYNSKDIFGRNLIHTSIVENNKDLFDLAVEYKLDVNARDDEGRTPLVYAIILKNKDFMEKLIKLGARVDTVDAYGFEIEDIAEPDMLKYLSYLLNKYNK